MSSPQLENGYIKIATEIFDAFGRFRIPGVERQILDIIIRKTYGYNKKEDWISNSQFVLLTGLKKGNICKAINSLVYKKIVIKKDNGRVPSYQFNKDYKSWRQLSKKKPVIKKETVVIKKEGHSELSKKRDTKDNNNTTKDNIVIPEWVDKRLWKEFSKMRTKLKKPIISQIAVTRLSNKLKELIDNGYSQEEVIGLAIERCWQTFYEPKEKQHEPDTKKYCTPAEAAHLKKLNLWKPHYAIKETAG
jgi:phage replication O-like protein O